MIFVHWDIFCDVAISKRRITIWMFDLKIDQSVEICKVFQTFFKFEYGGSWNSYQHIVFKLVFQNWNYQKLIPSLKPINISIKVS